MRGDSCCHTRLIVYAPPDDVHTHTQKPTDARIILLPSISVMPLSRELQTNVSRHPRVVGSDAGDVVKERQS